MEWQQNAKKIAYKKKDAGSTEEAAKERNMWVEPRKCREEERYKDGLRKRKKREREREMCGLDQ